MTSFVSFVLPVHNFKGHPTLSANSFRTRCLGQCIQNSSPEVCSSARLIRFCCFATVCECLINDHLFATCVYFIHQTTCKKAPFPHFISQGIRVVFCVSVAWVKNIPTFTNCSCFQLVSLTTNQTFTVLQPSPVDNAKKW